MSLAGSVWTGFGVPGNDQIAVSGNRAYVAPGEGDFQIFDITDPRKPTILGYLGVGFLNGVVVDGPRNYAYLVDSQGCLGGIIPVNVADPVNPSVNEGPQFPDGVQHWAAGAKIGDVVARNGYLLVTLSQLTNLPPEFVDVGCENLPALADDFVVLDATAPPNLTVVASMSVSGDAKGAFRLEVVGNYAYVGFVSGGAAVIDISDPTAPVLKGAYRGEATESKPPHLIGGADNVMVMTTWQSQVLDDFFGMDSPVTTGAPGPIELIMVDTTDPAVPQRVGAHPFVDDIVLPWQAVASGRYLNVVDQRCRGQREGCGLFSTMPRSRLLTFDILNPATPTLVNEFKQTERTQTAYVTDLGQYLYVNEEYFGFRIFDNANPAAPQPIAEAPMASEGRYAWVNDQQTLGFMSNSQTSGTLINIIDITDKARPVRLGHYRDQLNNGYTHFVGRGNVLYIAGTAFASNGEEVGGISIVDVTNPSAAVNAGDFPGSGAQMLLPRITLSGDYAYVTAISPLTAETSEMVLSVYDIGQAATPTLKSRLSLLTNPVSPNGSPQITVVGNHAYIMLTDAGTLAVVDISDASAPRIVGRLENKQQLAFSTPGEFDGRIAVANGYAYILTSDDYSNFGPNGFQLFYIVDVRDPTRPVYVSAFKDFTGVDFLHVGDHFYNPSIHGLKIIKLTE